MRLSLSPSSRALTSIGAALSLTNVALMVLSSSKISF